MFSSLKHITFMAPTVLTSLKIYSPFLELFLIIYFLKFYGYHYLLEDKAWIKILSIVTFKNSLFSSLLGPLHYAHLWFYIYRALPLLEWLSLLSSLFTLLLSLLGEQNMYTYWVCYIGPMKYIVSIIGSITLGPCMILYI